MKIFYGPPGCQFSQHRTEMKILKQKQKEEDKEAKTRDKRKWNFFTGLISIVFVFTSKTLSLKNELTFYDKFL